MFIQKIPLEVFESPSWFFLYLRAWYAVSDSTWKNLKSALSGHCRIAGVLNRTWRFHCINVPMVHRLYSYIAYYQPLQGISSSFCLRPTVSWFKSRLNWIRVLSCIVLSKEVHVLVLNYSLFKFWKKWVEVKVNLFKYHSKMKMKPNSYYF